ncbi:MAG: hypothetical protein KC619_29495 [Myxococcales bacterium]|nr:hypothetical protein [Myxococcales bacterium]
MRGRWVGVLALSALAACGGNDDDSGSSAPPPPPPPPRVSVGQPTTVTLAPTPSGGNAEASGIAIDFQVMAPGTYQCTAHGATGTEVRDAQMAILQGTNELARDSDSGDGYDAMIVQALTPGAYTVRVWEWQGRDASITVSCILAPAAPQNPTTIQIGAPVTVNVAAGQGPGGTVDLTLMVPTPGTIQCDATSTLDAQMSILQNGAVLQEDSDSGEGVNARIARALAPGAYVVRVWEWQHRPATITVTCAPPTVATNVAQLALGTPTTVTVAAGDGPVGQVHVGLTITQPGPYTCDATSEQDAQLVLLQNGAVLVEDSDSGAGVNARIGTDLQPGEYQLRVWEWLHRPTTVTVTCTAGLRPPEP